MNYGMTVKILLFIPLFMNALQTKGTPVTNQITSTNQVTLSKNEKGVWELRRNGELFVVRGLGGPGPFSLAKEIGANSIRTWGIEQLAETDKEGIPYLDQLHQQGLTVCAGIWIEHERHGFHYYDPKFLQQQREKVRAVVRKYRDHPALLVWGLGNEMEISAGKPEAIRVWKEMEILAKIVKEEDPHHPIMTAIAGADEKKIREIEKYYPSVDILGINAYSGAAGVGSILKSLGWEKPFLLTEYGPSGHWESAKTSWGAPLEPTANEKAATYYATLQAMTENLEGLCLGGYAFLWGYKQETTPTWYGLLLASGEKLPAVDALTRIWTGRWPVNRCPKIESLRLENGSRPVKAGERSKVVAKASDRDGDSLSYEWSLLAESRDIRRGGDAETVPPSFSEALEKRGGPECTLTFPSTGAYRLFLVVRDGQGGATTANLPFFSE